MNRINRTISTDSFMKRNDVVVGECGRKTTGRRTAGQERTQRS